MEDMSTSGKPGNPGMVPAALVNKGGVPAELEAEEVVGSFLSDSRAPPEGDPKPKNGEDPPLND